MQQYRKNLGKVSLTTEGAWDGTKGYDILSIVYDEHTQHGFISRQAVPEGVDLYNKEYWMPFNVSGYADNNVIILSKKTAEHAIQSYTLEEAIASIKSVGRRPGAILGFYNENADRLDIGGRWELWQFNDTNVYNWDNVDSWQNLYYNYNKFIGWYQSEEHLKKYAPFPEIGCYAFVGSEFNEATVYRCDNKYIWRNTTQHAWDYVKIVVDGNVAVGENGNWFNNGEDTGIPASVKGENGKTPVFREKDNTIQHSFDNVNWITISDKVAAWFRWNATIGDTQANNVGRIQISRDNVTWTNLSGDIINNLHISRYIGADESLPTSGIAEGTIYAKGPYYAEDDTLNDNPIYRLWVYAWKGNTLAWQDNGEFTSIAAGVVQETGDSETEVMSQKAVSIIHNKLSSEVNQIGSNIIDINLKSNTNYIYSSNGIIKSNTDAVGICLKVEEEKIIQIKGNFVNYVYLNDYPAEGETPISNYGNNVFISKVPTGANYLLITVANEDITINLIQGYTYKTVKDLANNYASIYEENGIEFTSIYGNPIIDFNIISNGGNEKIILTAAYKTDTRFLIQFKNDDNVLLSQLYITSPSLFPKEKTIVKCLPYNDSNVEIDVLIDVDKLHPIAETFFIKPTIKQKYFNSLPVEYLRNLEGHLFYSEYKELYSKTLQDTKTINVNIPASNDSSSRFTSYINWTENTIKIRVDKEVGTSTNYNLYTKGDTLTLIKNKLSYGVDYFIPIENPTEQIYLYSSTINSEGFVGSIHYSKGDSIEERINAIENRNLNNKTIICFGDSITEFKDFSGNSYPDYISTLTSANVINGGIGGTRLAQRTNPTLSPTSSFEAYASLDIVNLIKAWTSGDWSYVDAAITYLSNNTSDDNSVQVNNLKNININEVQIITLLGGTNDYTGNSIVGEINSIDAATINGALNEIIRMLLTANPKLKIYIFTPIVRYIDTIVDDAHWSDNYTKSNGRKLINVVDEIIEGAKRLHIPCCNLYWELGWNQFNFFEYFIDSDTTHPYKGFYYLAQKICAFINSKG